MYEKVILMTQEEMVQIKLHTASANKATLCAPAAKLCLNTAL